MIYHVIPAWIILISALTIRLVFPRFKIAWFLNKYNQPTFLKMKWTVNLSGLVQNADLGITNGMMHVSNVKCMTMNVRLVFPLSLKISIIQDVLHARTQTLFLHSSHVFQSHLLISVKLLIAQILINALHVFPLTLSTTTRLLVLTAQKSLQDVPLVRLILRTLTKEIFVQLVLQD